MVCDQWEMPAELDDSGQVAILHECTADGRGSCFVDAEHPRSKSTRRHMSKRITVTARARYLDCWRDFVTPAHAQTMHDEAAARDTWLVWVMTASDAEYPGKVIARARTADHQGGTLLPGTLVADTLNELRIILPIELTRRDRTSAWSPDVLETWD